MAENKLTPGSPEWALEKCLAAMRRDQEDLERYDAYLAGDHDDVYIPDDADVEFNMLAERAVLNLIPLVIHSVAQACYAESIRHAVDPGRDRDGDLRRLRQRPRPVLGAGHQAWHAGGDRGGAPLQREARPGGHPDQWWQVRDRPAEASRSEHLPHYAGDAEHGPGRPCGGADRASHQAAEPGEPVLVRRAGPPVVLQLQRPLHQWHEDPDPAMDQAGHRPDVARARPERS